MTMVSTLRKKQWLDAYWNCLRVDVFQQGAVKNPYVKKTIERDKVAIYGT